MARTVADPFKGVLLGMEFAVTTGTPVSTIAMGHACKSLGLRIPTSTMVVSPGKPPPSYF